MTEYFSRRLTALVMQAAAIPTCKTKQPQYTAQSLAAKSVRPGQAFWAALFMLCTAWPAQAQQTLPLTLDQAKQQALEQNLALDLARQEVRHARAMRLQTLAGHLPQINLSQQAVRTNDAVHAFGFKLKQERFASADFALDALNQPNAITDFQTSLTIHQPLFNGGQALHARRQATAALRMTQAQLTRHQQEISLHTGAAYWNLVLAQQEHKAIQQGLATAQQFAALAQAHVQQQTAPRTDLLAAQVRVAELTGERIAATNRVAQANDDLSLVLGLPSAVVFLPLDSLAQQSLSNELSELISTALNVRPDLQATAQQIEAARKGVRVEQAAYLPQLNAFARMDLDANKPFARQGESWMLGAVVHWNLFDGFGTVATVQQAHIRLAQAKTQDNYLEQQIERQVRQAYRAVDAAQPQISAAQEAVQLAQERLRISQKQYAEGLITATDLLSAETDLTQARIRHLKALHALHLGLSQVEFAVGQPIGAGH